MAQTIFITGASTGIGRASAQFFQAKGWNVVATMRKPEDGAALAELDNILVTRLDVLDQNSIQAAIQAGIDKFGKIDVLVNNAGYGAFGLLEAAEDSAIRRQFDTNVIGLLAVTRAIIPHFRKNKSGVLINISSVVGKVVFPLGSLYNGTKFAVEGISESLQFELAEIGVKVKIVEPGAIKTDFAGRSIDFFNDEALVEYQELVKKIAAMFQDIGQDSPGPEIVAEVIYQAATDGADTLRYTAGEDAKELIALRKKLDDAAFTAEFKKRLGL